MSSQMSASHRTSELLLRAEIQSRRETVVAYACELTPSSVFVVTDWRPPIETVVALRVSLPTLVEPVELAARVAACRPSRGIGSPAGLTFHFDSSEARQAVTRLLERLQPHGANPSPDRREYRVLLVEDNAFIRDMFAYGIAKYFEQHQNTVQFDHAVDASSARAKIEQVDYDLVIVDYYLPAEDGASFIARLRREPRFATAPIVAISVGGPSAREATLSAGADLFLDKPVVLRDLIQTLHVLSRRGTLA
jgi:CheY-like chemotaxis protein/Tfp pilus assembly protein PilZ